MKKESCELIRDLLPLYEDGVASEEAQKMVREHLKECPACREELDKLRAPVSLPPEPQEDAFRKRFEERQAQRRRVMRRRVLCAAVFVAALVAALIGAALWYTRPMTLRELCPGLDWDKADSLSGLCNVYETQPNGGLVSTFHTINLYKEEAGDTIAELVQILDSYTYRRSLTSLLPRMGGKTFNGNNPYWWHFTLFGGLRLSLDSFYPHKLDLSYEYGEHQASFYCRAEDQDALYKAVFELLASLPAEK